MNEKAKEVWDAIFPPKCFGTLGKDDGGLHWTCFACPYGDACIEEYERRIRNGSK